MGLFPGVGEYGIWVMDKGVVLGSVVSYGRCQYRRSL